MAPRRLLVIDDERVDRTIVMRTAANAGYATDGACGPAEAASLLDINGPFDFVVLDLSLGSTDGLCMLPILAEQNPAGVIVFVSGFDVRVLIASQRLATSLGLRVAGVLRKPLLPAALLDLLARAPVISSVTNHALPEVSPSALRTALAEERISAWFQAKICLATKQTIGAEALARWIEPDGRTIPPLAFVAVAERHDLIGALTDRMMDHALRTCAGWRQERPDCKVSVNLSPLLLEDPGLIDRVQSSLDRHGVPAGALILEITESIGVPDTSSATEILTRLRIKGVGLSVDDFGTGHSGLLSLVRLPFTELKIDQAFVRDALLDANAGKVVRASASLGRELGLTVVAEGVETAAQAQFVKDSGCHVGQGFLYSKAISAEAFATQLLRSPGRAPLLVT